VARKSCLAVLAALLDLGFNLASSPEPPVHVITKPYSFTPPNFLILPVRYRIATTLRNYTCWNVTSIPQARLRLVTQSLPWPSSLPVSSSANPPSYPIAHVLSFRRASSTEHSCRKKSQIADRHGPLHLRSRLAFQRASEFHHRTPSRPQPMQDSSAAGPSETERQDMDRLRL
jgi:hypothetical protein